MTTQTNALTQHEAESGTLTLFEHRESFLRKYASRKHHAVALDPGPMHQLALSADGESLAGIAGTTLSIWDTRARQRTHRFAFAQRLGHVALDGDGQTLIVADTDSMLHLVTRDSASVGELAALDEPITALTMDSAGAICVIGLADGTTRVLDIRARQTLRELDTPDVASRFVIDTSRDLLMIGQNGRTTIHVMSSGDLVAAYSENEVRLTEDELPWTQILTMTEANALVFNAQTGEMTCGVGRLGARMASTTDGSLLVGACSHRLVVLDGHSADPQLDLSTYIRAVRDVKISDDGEEIYICGHDATVEVYTSSGRWLTALADAYCSIKGAACTNDDRQLVVTDEQGFVSVYDLESGAVSRHHQHAGCISEFAVCGTRVVTGSYDGTAAVLDIESGETVRRVGDGRVQIQGVALDGHSYVITGNGHGAVQRYDIVTGDLVCTYHGNRDAVRSACVSPCGRFLATTAEGGAILLFDYVSGKLLHELTSLSIVYRSCFDAEGEFLYFGDRFGSVNKMNTATGVIVDHWKVLQTEIRTVTYHDGRVCAVGLFDDAVVLDATTGETQLRTTVDTHLCHRVAFLNGNGTRFVTGGQDGRLRIHDTKTGALLAELHHLAQGFLWMTAPDAEETTDAGWFWTDRPELVDIYSSTEDKDALLAPDDAERAEYIRMHNSRAATMARVGLSARAAKRDIALLAQTHRAALDETRQVALLEQLSS